MQGSFGNTIPKGIGVRLKPDTLDEENLKFEQQPLGHSLFLNSVPKCGSHLLRNVVRMFVPVKSCSFATLTIGSRRVRVSSSATSSAASIFSRTERLASMR